MGRSLLTVQGYVELMIDDEFIASRCAGLDEGLQQVLKSPL